MLCNLCRTSTNTRNFLVFSGVWILVAFIISIIILNLPKRHCIFIEIINKCSYEQFIITQLVFYGKNITKTILASNFESTIQKNVLQSHLHEKASCQEKLFTHLVS